MAHLVGWCVNCVDVIFVLCSFLVSQYLSEKIVLGLKMILSWVSYICMQYKPSNIFGGVCVIPSVTQYLQNVTEIPLGRGIFLQALVWRW